MSLSQRLIVDCRLIYSSGIGRYLQAQIPALSNHFDTTLLIHNQDIHLAVKYGLKYKVINAPIYSVTEQFAFLNLGDRKSIFWSPHYNVPFLFFQSKARIATVHDVCHLAFGNLLSKEKRIYAKQMIQHAVRKSEKIITVSEFSKKEIIRFTGCPEHKIEVIFNGTPQITHNGITGHSTLSPKDKYKLPTKYFLYVGNVKPHKNLKALLNAYMLLDKNTKVEYKVVIVGKRDGYITGDLELMRWVETSSELKESVHFTGFVDDKDLDFIYSNASLFIFPSLYEGFGLPPLEAMRNKCPVISSSAGSMPEICGDAALYFDPKNPEELSALIKQLVTDELLRADLVRKGLARIKKFTWAKSIDAHLRIFNAIL